MSPLVPLFAKHFIARPDVVAVQHSNGSYSPQDTPFTAAILQEHLDGNKTYGHYLLSQSNQCKFFCFDVDLRTEGVYWIEPDLALAPASFTPLEMDDWYEDNRVGPVSVDPRASWVNRDIKPRAYFKSQFRTIAEILTLKIHETMGIGTFATYSGHKGIHVYGMTGLAPAAEVRAAAEHVLAQAEMFVPSKGTNFFTDKTGEFPNLEVEIFPKQTHVEPGHYGNLLRLELGVNQKAPNDPTYFMDQTLPLNTFAPHPDPAWLLEHQTPWTREPANRP